jgi:hypothetical protein
MRRRGSSLQRFNKVVGIAHARSLCHRYTPTCLIGQLVYQSRIRLGPGNLGAINDQRLPGWHWFNQGVTNDVIRAVTHFCCMFNALETMANFPEPGGPVIVMNVAGWGQVYQLVRAM